jgi:hypothetical protein
MDRPNLIGIVLPSEYYTPNKPYRFFTMPNRFGTIGGFRGSYCMNSLNPNAPGNRCTNPNCPRYHEERQDYFSYNPSLACTSLIGVPIYGPEGFEFPRSQSYPEGREHLTPGMYSLSRMGKTEDRNISRIANKKTNDANSLWMAIYHLIKSHIDDKYPCAQIEEFEYVPNEITEEESEIPESSQIDINDLE